MGFLVSVVGVGVGVGVVVVIFASNLSWVRS